MVNNTIKEKYPFISQILLVVFTLAMLLFPIRALAAPAPALNCNDDLSPAGKTLFCNNAGSVASDKDTLSNVINSIATWLVGLIGAVLAVVILISAVQIVSSGGNPEAMKSAKNRLTQAAISLVLLISFRAILALLGI